MWAGYLIVAVVVLIIGAILGLMGKKALDQANPAPERAIGQAQQTIAAIKNPKGEPDAVAVAAGATTPPRLRTRTQHGIRQHGIRPRHHARGADPVSLTGSARSTPGSSRARRDAGPARPRRG